MLMIIHLEGQENYRKKVIDKGNEIIAKAEKEGKKIFVLAEH